MFGGPAGLSCLTKSVEYNIAMIGPRAFRVVPFEVLAVYESADYHTNI